MKLSIQNLETGRECVPFDHLMRGTFASHFNLSAHYMVVVVEEQVVAVWQRDLWLWRLVPYAEYKTILEGYHWWEVTKLEATLGL